MSQQPVDYGSVIGPPLPLGRRRMIVGAIGLGLGVAVTFAINLLPLSLGRFALPWPLLALQYNGGNILQSVAIGLIEWPLYGLLIGYAWPGRARNRAAVLIAVAAFHLVGVVACLRVLP